MVAVDSEKDSLLIQAYIDGDESAIATIITKYQKKIYNYNLGI